MGGTNIFANHDDILEVKEVGETNSFLYGYNPTRSIDVFENVNTPAPPSPARSTRPHQVPTTPVKNPTIPHGSLVSPLPKATTDPALASNLYCQDCSQHDDDNTSQLQDDDRSQHQQGRHQSRPLQNNEYSYPIGNAITHLREDKIEDLHSSLKAALSGTDMIRTFYDALRRRLKPQHIPLREWRVLAPNVDILDINPKQCANYKAARVVMSRAIFNLLDSHKDTLITDNFLKGELSMYDDESDGFGFISYMVSQDHPKFRHKVVKPSISASLKIPTFDDNLTIHEFCSNVKTYLENGNAPEHFTPFAAAQLVHEALQTDTRFALGCAYLTTELAQHNNKTGYAPPHLQLQFLPRTILDRYDHSMRSELSKPRRMNFSRVEFSNDVSPDLVAHRAFTRSQSREGQPPFERGGSRRQHNNRDNNSNSGRGGNGRGFGGGRGNGSSNRQSTNPRNGKDIPFVQCPCCGKPGHVQCDCRQKGSFVKLSQWYQMLTSAQRNAISAEMDRDARATHEKYKTNYKNRNTVRKRLTRIDVDATVYSDIDIEEEKAFVITACRTQMPDLDFGTLDPNFIDDIEPYLEFDPENEDGQYQNRD
jgi:hypothetical protein